jgi:hypothetical protein
MFLLMLMLNCQVLEKATVEGALGAVTQDACTFANSDYRLRVDVTKLKEAGEFPRFAAGACEGARDVTPVKAIGNEAVVCSVDKGVRLVSRVRDQGFTVVLNGTGELRKKVLLFAEQVAGNLF